MGIALADIVYLMTATIAEEHPRSAHVTMVALLHAALRAEVNMRVVGEPAEWFRKMLHGIVDEVLDYEERRKEVL